MHLVLGMSGHETCNPGWGHGCCVAAADLSEAGHEIRLWRREAAALSALVGAGGEQAEGPEGLRDAFGHQAPH